jgi:hypothetical protein
MRALGYLGLAIASNCAIRRNGGGPAAERERGGTTGHAAESTAPYRAFGRERPTRTAQSDLARADDKRIQALYRFNQAWADLARSIGHAEDTYGH